MASSSNQVRLNATVSVLKGVKSEAESAQTRFMRVFERSDNPGLSGIDRTFAPINDEDEGERRPPESGAVQLRVEDSVKELATTLVNYYDTVATQEVGNTKVSANVMVDGTALIPDAPVGLLLFLEKKLTNLHLVFSKLPVLSSSEQWQRDDNDPSLYVTAPKQTRVTKKVPKNHVLAPATDKHPAQVQMFHEDVAVGFWTTRNFSGAISVQRRKQILDRIDTLSRAVKTAREEANSSRVDMVKVGDVLFNYILNTSE